MKIGVLALQGDFAAHANILEQLNIHYQLINQPKTLETIDGLIVPGGESTTLLKLMQDNGLWEALKKPDLPIFGTCAGAILLAEKVISPEQISLKRIPMTIKRNAYGRQCESHIARGYFLNEQNPMDMLFIRAPRIREISAEVEVIAEQENEPVCVRYKNCLAATFHPEILADTRLHEYFVQNCL